VKFTNYTKYPNTNSCIRRNGYHPLLKPVEKGWTPAGMAVPASEVSYIALSALMAPWDTSHGGQKKVVIDESSQHVNKMRGVWHRGT